MFGSPPPEVFMFSSVFSIFDDILSGSGGGRVRGRDHGYTHGRVEAISVQNGNGAKTWNKLACLIGQQLSSMAA